MIPIHLSIFFLVYYFNGIEPSDGTAILQPVLQWGTSPAGGGKYWAIASWYVAGDQVMHSDLTSIGSGTSLTGVMSLSSVGPVGSAAFSYSSSFSGYANSNLNISNVKELTRADATLEALPHHRFHRRTSQIFNYRRRMEMFPMSSGRRRLGRRGND